LSFGYIVLFFHLIEAAKFSLFGLLVETSLRHVFYFRTIFHFVLIGSPLIDSLPFSSVGNWQLENKVVPFWQSVEMVIFHLHHQSLAPRTLATCFQLDA